MALVQAGTGKNVSNYGQGNIKYDPKTGSFTRELNGNSYIVNYGDEKYDSIKSEYMSRYGADPTNTNYKNYAPTATMYTGSGKTSIEYSDPYADRIAAAAAKVENYPQFSYQPYSYDQSRDAYAQDLKQQYIREGRRATEDAMGQVAAMTGGVPSSAAIAAGTQAGDYYNSQLNEALMQRESEMYGRWSSERSQALNEFQANFNVNLSTLSALQALSDSDYNRFMTELTTAAELEGQEFEKNFNVASLAAQYGDYSYLKAMGIDTTAYEQAALASGMPVAGSTVALNQGTTSSAGSNIGSTGGGGYNNNNNNNNNSSSNKQTPAVTKVKTSSFDYNQLRQQVRNLSNQAASAASKENTTKDDAYQKQIATLISKNAANLSAAQYAELKNIMMTYGVEAY